LCLALLGCRGAKTPATGNLKTDEYFEDTTDGWLEVQVEVDDNHPAFMISAESMDGTTLAVEEIYSPSGDLALYWEDWYYSTEFLTYAFWNDYADVFVNWPIRPEDGPLENGTWTVYLGSYNNNYVYTDAEIWVGAQRKKDTDLSSGTVHIYMIYAKGMRKVDGLERAVEDAVDRWEEVWAPYGLELEVEYAKSRIDPDLPEPGNNSGDLFSESSRTNGEQLVMIIGETIAGDEWTYGMSGGIPGSMLPSDRSAVVMSWLVHAGGDASFSDDEARLFGESMAHEAGHYMGLAHVVESDYEYWDALDDTPECSSQSACESSLGENLMFPYSICDWDSCVVTHELSDDQVGVSQRYCGTL